MRRTIAAVGRTLVTIGLLILLFVAYQLWGTNFLEARAQAQLEDEFNDLTEQIADEPEPEPEPVEDPVVADPTTTTTLPPLPGFLDKDVIGKIEIPKIGVDKFFVQGTGVANLKEGPGHYASTPMPGQLGNASIAGHRTTYGAPFNRVDELVVGDEIIVSMPNGGRYTYRVSEAPYPVAPTEIAVVETKPEDAERALLTLTTCHPEYSARQRLIVHAELVVDASPPPQAFDPESLPDDIDEELPGADRNALRGDLGSGSGKALGPATGWGLVVVAIGLGWWWLFRRWRHPLTWLVGVAPFLIFLFIFYVFLERALPSGI